MAEEIRPALSAAEWAETVCQRQGTDFALYPDRLDIVASDTGISLWSADHFPCLIALANHQLPDDDPRKLRREDVEALAEDIRELADRGGGQARSVHLLAKLSALLPPEGT